MMKQRGFSLIELLIVVAIILIIAAIAIPSFMRARMAANESSAAASLRTINTAEVSYATAYPTVGFTVLTNLGQGTGGACTPSSTSGCFLDAFLSNSASTAPGKDGFIFTITATASAYTSLASPTSLNTTGTRSFCSDQNGVIYFNIGALTCDNTGTPLQ